MYKRVFPSAIAILTAAYYITNYNNNNNNTCSIKRIYQPTCQQFINNHMGKEPIIIVPEHDHEIANKKFIQQTYKTMLMQHHGALQVKISTANAFTGREWTQMNLKQYINYVLGPQQKEKQGNQTLYLFGSQHGKEWEKLLDNYAPPTRLYPSEAFNLHGPTQCSPAALKKIEKSHTTLSFGIAGRDTGVPFHFHGPGFLQMLHGRKRWMLYPPNTQPEYHPNETTMHWVKNVLPNIKHPPTHDCVVNPGEIIYFPNQWMHATLNIDEYTCFIATFA